MKTFKEYLKDKQKKKVVHHKDGSKSEIHSVIHGALNSVYTSKPKTDKK